MIRQPAVAGKFYPGGREALQDMVASLCKSEEPGKKAIMAISPHAGYVYSGALAGQVLSALDMPRKVVLLGVNHRGLGERAAIMAHGAWRTPLGDAELDSDLGEALLSAAPMLREDALAHGAEHSLEVQVPLLQHLRPDLLLTPVALSSLSYAECHDLGKALAGVISASDDPVLVLSSTDMTHFESAEQAKAKDSLALERIQALDPEGLYNTVVSKRISMCGVLPTTVGLIAAIELGAKKADLIGYTHSGMVTGDHRDVVAYAGMTVSA